MKYFYLISGTLVVLLGLLWLTQGLGLVVIEPILCFGECKPAVGPAANWTIAGLLAMALGGVALFLGVKHR